MCYEAADKVAGALRDQSSEQEVEEGWNYLPEKERRSGGQ